MPKKSAADKTLAELFLQARDNGEGREAVRHLVEMELRKNPEDFRLLKMMGETFFYQENHEEAVNWLRKAAGIITDDEDVNAELGMSLYALGHYAEALPYLKKTLKLYPQDYDQHMMVGFALFKTDHRREAATHLKTALTHDIDLRTYTREITELALAGLKPDAPHAAPSAPKKSPA